MDETDPIRPTINATLIPHAWYFMAPNATTHGQNTQGTCTTVGMQLLLSFNNYFNDRRIIANHHLNAQNPHNVLDPMHTTSNILGSNQAYHDFTVNNYMTGSTWLTTAATEMRRLLNNRNGQIVGNINFTVNASTTSNSNPRPISPTNILNELNAGRPVAISTHRSLNGTADHPTLRPLHHVVVAYGHETKAPFGDGVYHLGYVTHFGWSHTGNNNARQTNVWTAAGWFYSYLTLRINQNHNYQVVLGHDGIHHELRCTITNHRTTVLRYTRVAGGIRIDGIRHGITLPQNARIIVPPMIYQQPVISIAASAFVNQTNLSQISIPASEGATIRNSLGYG